MAQGSEPAPGVPVLLTSAGLKRGAPDDAGLYVDPGGKPALREWTGTEWSPFLQVDPARAGSDEDPGPATVWSPFVRTRPAAGMGSR